MESKLAFHELSLTKAPQEYRASFWRRKLLLAAIAASVLVLSIIIAWYIPATHRSTAVILIEDSYEIEDLVQSMVSSYASQRIQTIKHRVTTTENLKKIVSRFGLYENFHESGSLAKTIKHFKKNIEIDFVNAWVLSPKGSRPAKATIAFKISYDNISLHVAQQVINELVTVFLAENAREKQRQVASTAEIFDDEARPIALR